MKGNYIIICFIFLLFSCSKQDQGDSYVDINSRTIALGVSPSVDSSEGSIVSKANEPATTKTTTMGVSDNDFRFGIYKDDQGAEPYPSDSYSKIYAYYGTGKWMYGYGSSDNASEQISLTVSQYDDVETLYFAGCCSRASTTGNTFNYLSSIYDMANFYVPFTTLSTSLPTHYYAAQASLDLGSVDINDATEYELVDLTFKPITAILKIVIKLATSQGSTVKLTDVNISAGTYEIVSKGMFNCVTGEFVSKTTTTSLEIYNSSSSLTTSAKSLYSNILPTGNFTSDLTIKLGFNDEEAASDGSTTVTIPTDILPCIEAGKVYVVNITVDNYIKFTNVDFETEWITSGDDIGTSI